MFDCISSREYGLTSQKTRNQSKRKSANPAKVVADTTPDPMLFQMRGKDFPVLFLMLLVVHNLGQLSASKYICTNPLRAINIHGSILSSVVHFNHFFGDGLSGASHAGFLRCYFD